MRVANESMNEREQSVYALAVGMILAAVLLVPVRAAQHGQVP